MFRRILIANRGEIALRILRACRLLGVETVIAHSKVDEDSMPVRLADTAVCIGNATPAETYLNIPALLTVAEMCAVDAIHPGIGFLAENENFARLVEAHGYVFIGPDPEHIGKMGDKIIAKETARNLGIPVVPGSDGGVTTAQEARAIADSIGYPVILKAAAGGGGRGMKLAHHADEIDEALSLCRTEARAAFGDDQVYIEKYLDNPRHIEIQVIGDQHGNCVHFFERDCSVQRRHQKVVEEAPSPILNHSQRQEIGARVTTALSMMRYKGVGTIEFLYEDGEFYFIEMNTRLQVEHTISEMITGVDLVKAQIRVAAGEKLWMHQDDIPLRGHAIECRINAEDPQNFLPSPGTVTTYHAPGGPGVRIDSHMFEGYVVPPYYDSLAVKLIVWAPDRQQCIGRTQLALSEFVISGIKTNLSLHEEILMSEDFRSGDYNIKWLENFLQR
ncbi:MAG: acetyl-CoA carboxylase biotin carboxylase subunit [Pseudomonadota bacterium]